MDKYSDDTESIVDTHLFLPVSRVTVPYLHKMGLTPNILTTLSLLTGVICTWCVWNGMNLWAIVSLIISYYFDCVDGMVARAYNQASEFGEAYDAVKDNIVAIMLFLVMYHKLNNYKRIILVLGYVLMGLWYGINEAIMNTTLEFYKKKLARIKRKNILTKTYLGINKLSNELTKRIFKTEAQLKKYSHAAKIFGSGNLVALTCIIIAIS